MKVGATNIPEKKSHVTEKNPIKGFNVDPNVIECFESGGRFWRILHIYYLLKPKLGHLIFYPSGRQGLYYTSGRHASLFKRKYLTGIHLLFMLYSDNFPHIKIKCEKLSHWGQWVEGFELLGVTVLQLVRTCLLFAPLRQLFL